MTRAWQLVDGAASPEGRLELRRRANPSRIRAGAAGNCAAQPIAGGPAAAIRKPRSAGSRKARAPASSTADSRTDAEGDEYVITLGGRVLMSSIAHRSESALADLACRRLARSERPRVLIGGLGMGFTLRATLDVVPKSATILVAEIDPTIVRWCRGPLATLTARATDDPRVNIQLADVATLIAAAAEAATKPIHAAARSVRPDTRPDPRFDAIILDLYEGPRHATQRDADPFYGRAALARTRNALTPSGLFAVWSEEPDPAFETRLTAAAFTWQRHRPGRGGPRHVVYLAHPQARRS
ncbi:MAG TPA: spermidine synthase [Thermoanaerobaculia bacterium]|nr:spermidine synthase [Thermoanaerobaculia bacterium]